MSVLLFCIEPDNLVPEAAVCGSHGVRLLSTLLPSTSVPALSDRVMRICSLPSQSRVPDSLLRIILKHWSLRFACSSASLVVFSPPQPPPPPCTISSSDCWRGAAAPSLSHSSSQGSSVLGSPAVCWLHCPFCITATGPVWCRHALALSCPPPPLFGRAGGGGAPCHAAAGPCCTS